MNDHEFITSYSLLKNYRNDYPQVLKKLEPLLKTVERARDASKKSEHHVLVYNFNDKPYLCSIFESSFHHYCYVYLLLPRKNYFEAFAFDPASGRYILYHDHFFLRYVERLNLHHKSPMEILKHYVDHNPLIVFSRYIKRKGDIQNITAVVRTGVLYGYIDHAHGIINYRTMIPHHTLTKKKTKYTHHLRKELMAMESSQV